ncbi:MAG: hypothetical protein ACKVHP_18840, partial [Verrucomicrobiales bacterium]
MRPSLNTSTTVRMQHSEQIRALLTRRHFFGKFGTGVGMAAVASMLNPDIAASDSVLSFAPKAKRVIDLFQSGAPSQLETLDYKPNLAKHHES